MGDIISFGDSLIITVFSMVVVFLGLMALAMLISVLKSISIEKKEVEKEAIDVVKPSETVAENTEESEIDDSELVAVIAAAIAASLGVNVPDINISSIKRIPQSSTAWSSAGRQEQIYGKL